MYRLEVRADESALQQVWAPLFKNKDGTVNMHEFIRHFGAPPKKCSAIGQLLLSFNKEDAATLRRLFSIVRYQCLNYQIYACFLFFTR